MVYEFKAGHCAAAIARNRDIASKWKCLAHFPAYNETVRGRIHLLWWDKYYSRENWKFPSANGCNQLTAANDKRLCRPVPGRKRWNLNANQITTNKLFISWTNIDRLYANQRTKFDEICRPDNDNGGANSSLLFFFSLFFLFFFFFFISIATR